MICGKIEVHLRHYRTKIVRVLRSLIFCQAEQEFRRHTDVCQGIFGQDDGKDAGKTYAKLSGGLCAVLP